MLTARRLLDLLWPLLLPLCTFPEGNDWEVIASTGWYPFRMGIACLFVELLFGCSNCIENARKELWWCANSTWGAKLPRGKKKSGLAAFAMTSELSTSKPTSGWSQFKMGMSTTKRWGGIVHNGRDRGRESQAVLRPAVACPNVTGRIEDRETQSKCGHYS